MSKVQWVLFNFTNIRYPLENDYQGANPVTRRAIPLLLSATLVVSGCAQISQSRYNPLNWFQGSAAAPVATNGRLQSLIPAGATAQVVDGRGLIDTVTALSVNKTPDGAIVQATGVASTQGQFNAQLVPSRQENGVLTFAFRIETPAGFQGQGGTLSRQVNVARSLSNAELAGVRTIRVQAARNARTSSR